MEDFIKCIHSIKGRLRFRLTDAARNLSPKQKKEMLEKKEEILKKFEALPGIEAVRINPIIFSMIILYNPQVTAETIVISSLNSIIREYFQKR